MQLDQTHVVIRLRTLSEIGDLTLALLRRYPSAIFIGFALGAIAWTLLDLAALSWIPLNEANYGLDDDEATTEILRYLFWMAVLVTLQAPSAGVLTTLYLGSAVFERRPPWAKVRADARQQFRQWFWKLAVLRMAAPPLLLLALRWGQPASFFFDAFVPFCLLIVVAWVRGMRPFLPEILLLERCPLRSNNKKDITAKRRSTSLHRPFAGELAGRFILISATLFILLICTLYTMTWIRGIAVGQWDLMDLFVLLVIYPFALWIVAGISVFVRMLNYLDARIRLEGWEVELAIRAEAIRQFGEEDTQAKPPAPTPDAPSPQHAAIQTQGAP